eukprot:tig00020704_g13202.t1
MLPPGGAGVPLPRSDEESVHGEGPGGEGAPGHRRGAGTLQVRRMRVAILISYALAGSTAYGQLMGVETILPQRIGDGEGWPELASQRALIGPFVIFGALFIVFGARVVDPFISVFTLAKGALLVAMVGVALAVGVSIGQVPLVASELRRLRAAISLGIITCWPAPAPPPAPPLKALNVAWCAAVLMIVPQNGDDSAISLRRAADRGEISTVPVIQIIMTGYRQHAWIAGVITLFIVVSITVSFITLGNALKHTLDGLAGFLVVMEAACSLALNLECGIFVVLMLAAARTFSLNPPGSDPGPPGPPPTLLGVLKRWILPVAGDNTGVPLPASSISSLAQPVVCVYFAFAVGYDFYIHTAGTRVF